MEKLTFVFALVLAILVHGNEGTGVSKCDKGSLPDVTISGCSKSPCQVKLGTTMELTVKFKAASNVKAITPQMLFSAGNKKNVPFPIGNNACDNLVGAKCPLKKGDQGVYVKKVAIPSAIPAVCQIAYLSYSQFHFINLTSNSGGRKIKMLVRNEHKTTRRSSIINRKYWQYISTDTFRKNQLADEIFENRKYSMLIRKIYLVLKFSRFITDDIDI